MAQDYPKILKYGTQAAYEALGTKDSSVLYFCTDSGKIYRGTVDFSNSVIVAASKPATPVVGKVYVLADTNTVEIYTSGAWKVLSYPVATAINVSSDDVHVATAKAVYDAIQTAVADLSTSADTVKAIAAGTDNATLVLTRGDDTTANVVVPGVVTAPTWDATTRVLTLPVSNGTPVEVNIGKDMFLDPTANNRYDEATQSIYLYLNDGADGSAATELVIPVGDLIDVYTGGTTDTVAVSVSNNEITATVKVDPSANNSLVASANGLMVDLTAYAKSQDVADEIADVNDLAQSAKDKADANETAIQLINGDATTDGSIKKQIADAIAPLTQADIDFGTEIATMKTNIQTNTDNIAALALAATTWGTF